MQPTTTWLSLSLSLSAKWNYLGRRAGKLALVRLSSCVVAWCRRSVPPSSGVFITLPAHRVPVVDVDVECSPQPHYNSLAAGWPKICQVHVALLGFPACSLVAAIPSAVPCQQPVPTLRLRCQVNAPLHVLSHKHARLVLVNWMPADARWLLIGVFRFLSTEHRHRRRFEGVVSPCWMKFRAAEQQHDIPGESVKLRSWKVQI